MAIQETGIEVAQCHLPFRGKRINCHTPEDLAYYYEMFYRAIDVASFLNVPWGVIHPDTFKGSGLSDEECCKLNHENNDKYIEYALNRGLNIAYENMTLGKCAGYCTYVDQLIHLIDSYKDDRIGACLDTGHANMVYKDQYEPIIKLGHRLHCTHINDNLGTDDLHSIRALGLSWIMVGASSLEYANVIEALEKGDFYMSCGPEISSLTMEGTTLKVTCSDAQRINLESHGRFARLVTAEEGSLLREASFDLSAFLEKVGDNPDVCLYLTVTAPDGTYAATRAYYLNELKG